MMSWSCVGTWLGQIANNFFFGEKQKSDMLVAQSCLTLCDPMDCSPPSSSVHGILQARILEWVSISFSRVSSWPWDWNLGLLLCRQTLYHLSDRGILGSIENRSKTELEVGLTRRSFWKCCLRMGWALKNGMGNTVYSCFEKSWCMASSGNPF